MFGQSTPNGAVSLEGMGLWGGDLEVLEPGFTFCSLFAFSVQVQCEQQLMLSLTCPAVMKTNPSDCESEETLPLLSCFVSGIWSY